MKVNKSYIVYLHTSPSGKRYVGITSQSTNNRWRNGKGYKRNEYFTKAINKHGWENFVHEILFEGLSEAEASQKERELIALYRCDEKQFGYNLTSGGEDSFKPSEETRAKMRKPKSELGKRNMSLNHADVSGKNNPMYGKTFSEQHRANISNALKELYKIKQHPMSGKCRSGELAGNKRAVIQYSADGVFINKYINITEASKFSGAVRQHISKCCNGQRKTTGGYCWRYAKLAEPEEGGKR